MSGVSLLGANMSFPAQAYWFFAKLVTCLLIYLLLLVLLFMYIFCYICMCCITEKDWTRPVYRGADKSLARP